MTRKLNLVPKIQNEVHPGNEVEVNSVNSPRSQNGVGEKERLLEPGAPKTFGVELGLSRRKWNPSSVCHMARSLVCWGIGPLKPAFS